MKDLYIKGLLLICLCYHQPAICQVAVPQHLSPKPLLFAQLPVRLECERIQLQKIFTARTAQSVTIQLNNELELTGEVMEKVQKSPAILSMNIRLSNFPGALLNLSLITQSNQAAVISGRIVHPQSGDAFVIMEESNRYVLKKQEQQFFMTE